MRGESSAPVLDLTDISMRFPDGTEALSNVELRVGSGEFVSLVGPSGCGKSTLLRIAAGLETPTGGTVTRASAPVGYVFQEANLLPWRTVAANAALFGELHGIGPTALKRRVDAALSTVGLAQSRDLYPRQLSGGMAMRVSLARSLVLESGAHLFDEPFGALDEMTRHRLNEELSSLFSREQFAAVFVTHSIAEAVWMSSRVVVLSARPGRIIDDIPIEQPFPRNPAFRFDPEFARLCGVVSASLNGASHD